MNKNIEQNFNITDADIGKRLDVFCEASFKISRSAAKKLIDGNNVKVNGKTTKSSYLLKDGDTITYLQPNGSKQKSPPHIPVIYEDNHIIVINKPAGVTVHEAPGEEGVTINELFADKFTGAKNGRELIVHRLDKATSGVMVLAKSKAASDMLKKQFADRLVEKRYIALVHGDVQKSVINIPLGRSTDTVGRIFAKDTGKSAYTEVKPVRSIGGYTLINVFPKTGRTHQIRVHLSLLGHPIFGDRVYGKKGDVASRMFLHAASIQIIHPSTGKKVQFSAPMSDELENMIAALTVE